ncbi:MAG: cell division protein FtsZ [Candidatus Altiarchaeales archaeon ex4484_96]|nr:MAG: cell division protein FtsZ [Candidatus Altiarchaeales archaeon ex4484_96]
MDSIVSAALQHGKLERRDFDEFEGVERPKIVVLGSGGAGNNTINRLEHIGIEGAELIASNTDKQDLKKISGDITRILIGAKLMGGLGAGGFPELGAKAAEASRHELDDLLANTHLLFLTAGMGGGTGTGSAPVIAEIAKEQGAIVVAIVTFPFKLERSRLDKARKGIENLKKVADTVIIIDNNKLVQYVPNLPIDKAFSVADEVVARAVKGITETIMEPSLVNLDFADIKAVLNNGHITGGEDMTLGEANAIGELITKELRPDASVTWGARIDPKVSEKIEVITIITGVKSPHIVGDSRYDESSAGAFLYTEEFYKWDKGLREV